MARKEYETQEDQRNEAGVANKFAEFWGYDLRKLPDFSAVDYLATLDEALMGWIEIKCRNIAHNAYPDLMISKKKIDHCLQLAEITQIPAYLVISWTDRIGYLEVFQYQETQVKNFAGRTVDTRDEQDIESCVYIPIGQFLFLDD